MCSSYNLWHVVNRQTDSFWPAILLAQRAELKADYNLFNCVHTHIHTKWKSQNSLIFFTCVFQLPTSVLYGASTYSLSHPVTPAFTQNATLIELQVTSQTDNIQRRTSSCDPVEAAMVLSNLRTPPLHSFPETNPLNPTVNIARLLCVITLHILLMQCETVFHVSCTVFYCLL